MWHSIGVEEHAALDAKTHDMLQIKPNPFRQMTKISCDIEHSAQSIELSIYDVAGRLVRNFDYAMPSAPCTMQISWDGCDDAGKHLPDGVYICRLETDGTSVQKKIVLLR